MNILMINQDQFGYKAGYYHYCKHLAVKGYNIIYLCNDHGLKKVSIPGVKVIYVNIKNPIKWRIKFCSIIKEIILEQTPDIVMCSYYRGCSIHALLFKNIPIIIDIRSGDISNNRIKRNILNTLINFESRFFNHTIVLSISLAKKLNLKTNSYDIVPLGSDIISEKNKQFNTINLLYVGTLHQRNIYKTIEGISIFKEKHPEAELTYDIIGFGEPDDENKIKDSIKLNNLGNTVKFHGRISYEFLSPYFDKNNIGVAFVPKTAYFDCQPCTKIYEYTLSGMYCIATNTSENKLTISHKNGILCDDNALAFSNALEQYYTLDKSSINSDSIRSTLQDHSWEHIIDNQLIKILSKQITTFN